MTSVPRFGHGSRVPGWDDAVDIDKPPSGVPDPATTPVPDALRTDIEAFMARYPDRRSAAIPALHAAQRVHGYCSPEALDQVAAVMRLTPGYLAAVATFYDMLQTTPKAPHDVFVCTNISCSMRGADEIYEAMLDAARDDASINVRSFECLGACDIAPMASVDGEYVGPLDPEDTERIVADIGAGRPVLEAKQLRRRRSADPGAMSPGAQRGEDWVAADDAPRADAVGVGPIEDPAGDRPGPTAAIEPIPSDDEEEDSE